jgi:hypothetical protein
MLESLLPWRGSPSALLLCHQRSHQLDAGATAQRDPFRTQAATPPASGDTRATTNAGVGPALTRDVLVATNAHVARRRRIGPRPLAALTERREAASTKAVTTASTPGLPLQA